MGHKFYEADIPKLTSVLEKIASQLESLNEREEKKWKLDERLKRVELKDKLNEGCGTER
jgi:DNA repair ATPase RecN|tara:strand:+ start:1345 stop:1521 length:177 start_codon:yes stop_codon:yes gene_type:complete